MRIAYVINSLEGGGAALPVPAVAGVLSRLGAQVEVFALTRRDGRALPAMTQAGLKVHVRPGGEKDHAQTFKWLDQAMAEHRPDVIWTSLTRATLLGQIVGLRRRLPVVSWQHAAYLKPANKVLLRASRRLSRLWIGDSHSVTALTAKRLAVPPASLATWPLFAADPLAPRAAAWWPGQVLELGTLGRLHPVKGHHLLLDALAHLRAKGFVSPTPFRLRIAGEGAQREVLQARIDQDDLGGQVELTGFCDAPKAFLSSLHLYLQPSRSEGLCIAAHEAMQAGLPLIVSAVGELPYSVVDGVTGFVVEPNDPEDLARALRKALMRPDRLADFGEASHARVFERFGQAAFERAGAEVFGRLPRTGPV
jgi:glycosyltransferase involved in cell wall biosynthesis